MSSCEDSAIRVSPVPGKRVVTTFSGGLAMENAASLAQNRVAWVGRDWAGQAHAVCLQAAGIGP